MTKKTKHLGYESGKSSPKYFTPNPMPHTGDGKSSRSILDGLKLVFRSGKHRK